MIPPIPSVLASTDFSDFANEAIPQAYAAVDDGGTVHLIHVVELAAAGSVPNPLYAHYTPGRTLTRQEREAIHSHCAERLQALVPEGAEQRRISTKVHVVDDPDVASAIARAAEECAVSLICIASHGRTGLRKALFGSVAQHVLGKSRCPVLVVRAARARS